MNPLDLKKLGFEYIDNIDMDVDNSHWLYKNKSYHVEPDSNHDPNLWNVFHAHEIGTDKECYIQFHIDDMEQAESFLKILNN